MKAPVPAPAAEKASVAASPAVLKVVPAKPIAKAVTAKEGTAKTATLKAAPKKAEMSAKAKTLPVPVTTVSTRWVAPETTAMAASKATPADKPTGAAAAAAPTESGLNSAKAAVTATVTPRNRRKSARKG